MSSSEALRIKYSDPVDPWEMLDTPWGHMPAWKAATYATGTTEAAMRAYEQVRNDSASIVARHDAREAELNARADAIADRERAHAVGVTNFVDFVGKASVLFDRLMQTKSQADAEAEPEELPLPPGHSSELPDPALNADEDPSPPAGGKQALTPEQQEREFAGHLRLNHPVTRNQDDPPVGGVEFPDPELPHPPEQQQQVALGLDKE